MQSARNVMESVLGLFGKRFELAATELQEEKYRLIDQLFRAIMVGVLALMALMMISFLIIVVSWDTAARIYVIAGLALLYGIAGWRVFVTLRQKLEDSPKPFAATVDEIRKDAEWFQK